MSASGSKKQDAGLAGAVVAILLAIGLLNAGTQPKPRPKPKPTTTVVTTSTSTTTTPTTTTGSVTTTIVSPPDSGADATDALVTAVAAGDVVIDRPLTINKVAKITASNRTITFVGEGKLVRTTNTNPTGDNVTFPVLLFIGSSNVTLVNPQIIGPGGVCNVPRPTGGGVFRARYDSRYEESAGITLEGVTNFKISGGTIRDVRGDGVKIFYDHTVSPSRPSSQVTIENLTTRCVGRAAIANISSDRVTVNGGNYAESGFWTFNVEPFNVLAVTNYELNGPTVGYSTSAWLFAGGGPYASCQVEMRVNKPVFTELVMPESIASCVRSTVIVVR